MTLNNVEERRAWVAFAAACRNETYLLADVVKEADTLLEEYRARLPKAEEPTGPDWSTAPEWATLWVSQDDKVGYWLEDPESEPAFEGGWDTRCRYEKYTGPYVYPGDWRDSKQRRPSKL